MPPAEPDHGEPDQVVGFGPAQSQAGAGLSIHFESRGDRLLSLGAINGALKLVTAGIYSFWGKTEVRRRLWSFTRLNGEPLEYTGTGRELFLGFLIVFAVVVLPALLGGFAVALLFPGNKAMLLGYQITIYALFFFLVGNAMYRARRYRLSRTRWRGIRGALDGSAARYGWTYFWTLALPVLLTLAVIASQIESSMWSFVLTLPALALPMLLGKHWGIVIAGILATLWVMPWRANLLYRQITNDTRFGDQALRYDGGVAPLYQRYLFTWLGSTTLYAIALLGTLVIAHHYGVLDLSPDMPDVPPAPGPVGEPMPDADPDADITGDGEPADKKLPPTASVGIGALWLLATLAVAVVTAWYRARQMQHFAAHTHLGTATFRSTVTGKGLMWLTVTNWLLGMSAVLLAVTLAMLVIFGLTASGTIALPAPPEPGTPGAPGLPGLMQIVLTVMSVALIVIASTIATTFAQFRSARYFVSRMQLDGPVDLAAILQSSSHGPRRGEGLAQVFDLDAF